MKKIMILFGFVFFLIGSTSMVHADMGPKPVLKITIDHQPDEIYYVDLLVRESYIGDIQREIDQDHPEIIEGLRSLESQGWFPALVSGTQVPLFGDLKGDLVNGKMVHTFGYRIPDEFRIILVTTSGKVVVSELVKTESFYMSVHFDAISGEVILPNLMISYTMQFFTTFIPTLLLEGVILFLFGLASKRNLKVFFVMNLITQIFLTATLGVALITQGLISAIFVLILVEGFIWIYEIIVCWKLFDKQKKTGRRILFALAANSASFILGLFLIFVQMSWL